MDREIKFRAWDRKNKKFALEINMSQNPMYWADQLHADWELTQFTGLHDKNGKEIYEGDIIEWKYLQTWHKNEVRWVGGGFVVTTSGFKDDLNEPQDLSLVSILNCEIIGNIYENPELIK